MGIRIISLLLDVATALVLGLAGCGGNGSKEIHHNGSKERDLSALQVAIASLEHRKSLIRDADDIKRLQRSYGYYFDQALWDDVADLFAEDGTIEIGLDGVYVGKDRVCDYLYAFGGGKSGLSEGQLNETMQLMPVITVAADGKTAKGRWRAIIMKGQLGNHAIWGEGQYENEYVKQDGIWKIQKLHWYQTFAVPYEGGWQINQDVNQGIWASDILAPDQPPSVTYETWPNTFLPPFHFPNPVREATPVDHDASAEQLATGDKTFLQILARQAALLAHEVERIQDENEIENLQRIYGYYIDKGFWSEAASLFTDDGTIETGGKGVFVGKDRVLALLRSQGDEFPQEGRLYDQMQLQPVVHVAPDGNTAKARWRLFSQEAVWSESAHWRVGFYENSYVKEKGVWKIQNLHEYTRMATPYEDGWGKTALPVTQSSDELPPDRPPTVVYESYPAVFVGPFHYHNPVTGEPVYRDTPHEFAQPPATSIEKLEEQIDRLRREIGLLEDLDQIERLHAIYGYYLASNEWDNLAGIFAPDGSIEIALRGVYIGRDAVRRHLDLYGSAGMQTGLLHNHMQFQSVIHLADDGLTAKMRSRAFSMIGQHELYSMWMGGIYENEFVKRNGIWQIQKDQHINTYLATYDVGWKDLAPRPPPGISETNPPDQPPSLSFEMYPSAFLPPYHYANPVTGIPVTWP